MTSILDKWFAGKSTEERWTEYIAVSGGLAMPIFLAAVGFMLGPVFTPYNNDLDYPGPAHYSIPGAIVGFGIGAVAGVALLVVRYRAMKWEEAHHAHEHDVLSTTVTDLDPEERDEPNYI